MTSDSFDAIKQSFNLVRGNWWRTLGVFVVIPLLPLVVCVGAAINTYIIIILFLNIPEALAFPLVGVLIGGYALILVFPMIAAWQCVLYHDLTLRQKLKGDTETSLNAET